MKLKYALIAVFILGVALPATASIDPNFERHKRVTACKLNATEITVLNARWNKLAMRHFMASTEARIDPRAAERVRREIDKELDALRREFGPACVLDII